MAPFLLVIYVYRPFGAELQWRQDYFAGATVSRLVTLSAPATAAALASMFAFSSSDAPGPLSVTLPFCVMILTLCEWVERALSCTMALRICRDVSRSAGFIFCWSAVIAPV